MKINKLLSVIALSSIPLSSIHADEATVHLFLSENTAQTKIDGLKVSLRAELTDKDQSEREFTHTPRVWITCFDGGRQIMTIDTADDLDPWPSVTEDAEVVASAKLISQTGSFSQLSTQLRAFRATHLMKISVDVTGRAEDVARSWVQGFPIKITASPGSELKDLDLVIFPEAMSPSFGTEAAALVRGCEVLRGN